MFGRNERRPRDKNPDLLQVRDIFYTIQGEGPFSGQPAVFIRLTGCNLSCWFCDTVWDDEKDGYYGIEVIIAAVETWAKRANNSYKTRLVVITGGEPLRQDLSILAKKLHTAGFAIQIETAGIIWQDWLKWPCTHVVVSPKTKKVHDEFYKKYLNVYWKYVIKAGEVSKEDGLPNGPTQRLSTGKIGGGAPARPPAETLGARHRVYLSPMDEHDYEATANNHLEVGQIAMKYGYRCGVQLHKPLNLA